MRTGEPEGLRSDPGSSRAEPAATKLDG